MKRMKRLASLMLAMILAVMMVLPVSAVEKNSLGYTITITDSMPKHTYEAYQIFAGDLLEEEEEGKVVHTLSNIKWGNGVNTNGQDNFGDAATKAESLTTTTEAMVFAKELEDYLQNPKTSVEKAGVYTISGLEAGYYLVKDQDNSLTNKDDSYTSYILRVVADQNVTTKSDMSTVEKRVKDIDDSTSQNTTDWQDSADYDIGDDVPFQLKAILANNVESYEIYKVVFHDTLSSGLTYNEGSTVVKIKGVDQTKGFTIESDNNQLTVSCDDVKKLGATNGSDIIVEYTAKLNDNAVLGSQGNPNKVYLEYSNNPNNSMDGTETGNTEEDTVIVFTYKVVINKVDEESKPLEGAVFTLEKLVKTNVSAAATWKAIDAVKVNEENPTTFTFSGLDDGEYRLTETTTPSGYNTMEQVVFTVSASHDANATEPKLTALSGDKVTGEIAFSADVDSGALGANVINYAGHVLPSTGGMGTTVFYAVGSVLVLGAVVVLITKKRMNAEK